jgi:CheY-like chemotaxis protein
MRRILVVDDSELMHSLMKYTLSRLKDFEVSYARNGKEALDFVTTMGEPSLILLDINMPVMDGLDLLRRLSSLGMTKRIPVIILSTEGRDADVLRGLEAGARAYLPKPFKAQDLHTMIERVLS